MKWMIFLAALGACGGKSAEPPAAGSASATATAPAPMVTPTVPPPHRPILTGKGEVMVDGQPGAISKVTGRLDARSGQLTLDFQLGAPPYPGERQLSIFIKDFAKQPGPVTNATAQWARVIDKAGEMIYGNRTAGAVKLALDKFEAAPERAPGSTALMIKVRHLGTIDGTFEGDLACETCLGPNAKAPFAQPVHLTAGKFTGVPITQY